MDAFASFSQFHPGPEHLQTARFYRAFLQFLAILKPMGAFAYSSRFRPGRPEPLQTARFYQHSFNFERYCNQWVLLLTFRGFSLAAQNPSRLHDFTSIPSILTDIKPNECFRILFAVSAWPPRTPPACKIPSILSDFDSYNFLRSPLR